MTQPFWYGVGRDLWDAARQLRRAPRFAAIAILSIGLGIGGTAATISIVDAVLIRDLPYPDADRLVRLDGVFTRLPLRLGETGIELTQMVEAPELADARSFAAIGAFAVAGVNLGEERPERLRAAAVTPGFFAALAVEPIVGRVFTVADLRETDRLAVISFALWRRRFRADPSVVGRSLDLNGRRFAIAGVMPESVDLPDAADLWIPRTADGQIAVQVGAPVFVARLAPGVTAASATQEVRRLLEDSIMTRQEPRAPTLRITPLHDALVRDVRPVILFVGAASLLLLIVACVNTATLMLGRMSAREREFAVRRTMGASTLRLARLVLCESALIVVGASALAVPVASGAIAMVHRFTPATLHGAQAIALDVRSFLALSALALITAALLGAAPAISASVRATSLFRSGSAATVDRTWRRFRSALVTTEIAMAVAILVCASSIVRTVAQMIDIDLGARNDRALVMEITLPRATYASLDRILRFHDRLHDELRLVPGVEAVGATNHLPGSTGIITPSFRLALDGHVLVPGRASDNALRLSTTPGYFAALGIDVLAGRPFADTDRRNAAPVAIVSESFARAFKLQPAEILGHRVTDGLVKGEAEVVGVVRDVRMRGPESDLQPALYRPFAQVPINATAFVAAKVGTRSHAELMASIRAAVARVDAGLPLYNVRTFEDVRSEYLATRRFAMTAMVAFGSVAFALACLGLYALVSYMVRLRAREIGIRLAIGAAPSLMRRQVIGSGALHAAMGTALGAVIAASAWTLVSAAVPGVGEIDPALVAAVSALVFGVAVAAVLLPAQRAARIDPVVVLRGD
jgi:putative ABC transport system permease protein